MADGGLGELRRLAGLVLDEVERAVVGKRDVLELVLLGLLADGHVLLEDVPGLAKTLIARSFAAGDLGCGFARVQFTPDLMPSDVTGSSIYDQRPGDFEFRPGPVFTNLLLGDEINRAPPKTQAALLEAMQERQVTIDGVTRPLERPFLVAGHPEPDRVRGHLPAARGPARPVPAAAVGRLPVGRRRVADAGAPPGPDRDEVELARWSTPADAAGHAAGASRRCTWPTSVGRYIVELASATRASPRVQVGASPAGQPGPAAGGPGPGRPGRPRLRHPRGRQGGRRPRPGPPAAAAARAVGARRPHRGRGRRAARAGPDPAPQAEPAAVRSRQGRLTGRR